MLNAVLSTLEVVGVGIHLHQREVTQVLGFVDFTFVEIHLEEIVVVVACKVVVVVGKDVLLCKIRTNCLIELHPEHRVTHSFAAKLVGAVKHRADCLHMVLHLGGDAVKLPLLDDIVAQYLVRRYVGIFNLKFRVLLGATLSLGVENVETVEHFTNFHLILVGENLSPVEIFIHCELVVGNELHDDAEEVHAVLIRLFGVVESHILLLLEVELTVDYLHPLHIGIACLLFLIERLHSGRHLNAIFLVSVARLALAHGARSGFLLCNSCHSKRSCQECHCYVSNNLHNAIIYQFSIIIFLFCLFEPSVHDYFHRGKCSLYAVGSHRTYTRNVESLATRQAAETAALTL